MGARRWAHWLFAALACALLATPAAAQNNAAFERGYREGIQHGADDGRNGRQFEPQRDSVYRDGDRGYNSRYGTRDGYRNEFRRGFTSGYREGYYNVRGNGRYQRDDRINQGRRDGIYTGGPGRTRGYQDPAYARGYSDGWEKGRDDGRDRDRYDPVRHGDYKDADNGYERSYGSKDAYENNYRSGFRQGYEAGYRDRGAYRR
jgi:flagellar biosynthesis/type III secretory pathway protein FliH